MPEILVRKLSAVIIASSISTDTNRISCFLRKKTVSIYISKYN